MTGGDRSPVKWFLMHANRMTVAGLLTISSFVPLMILGVLDLSLRPVLQTTDTIETLFQTLIGVLITGMTLVVSINQLVLSQEFGSLGRQRERMDKSMQFRQDSEREFQWTGPPEPDRFLKTLANTTLDRAEALRTAVEETDDQTLQNRVEMFVDRITTNTERVTDELENANFGEFTVMQAALGFNYSWKIYVLRRMYWEHQESLSDDEQAAFDDVVDVLELFGPAEAFFKAHYLQWELVNLSRRILFTGVPALITAVAAALYLKPSLVSGSLFGVPLIVVLINIGVTFALLPFFVFTAYVFRIATIAKEGGAIGPFVLHESERAPLIDWDD